MTRATVVSDDLLSPLHGPLTVQASARRSLPYLLLVLHPHPAALDSCRPLHATALGVGVTAYLFRLRHA